jgi:hypothetical protein
LTDPYARGTKGPSLLGNDTHGNGLNGLGSILMRFGLRE